MAEEGISDLVRKESEKYSSKNIISPDNKKERRVLKNLAKEIYLRCREMLPAVIEHDLRELRIPGTEKELIESLQGHVHYAFQLYQDNPYLSYGVKEMLPQIKDEIIRYIPHFVKKRKEELGIKENGKSLKFYEEPAGKGLIIGGVVGALFPDIIAGVYSTVTGDQTLKETVKSNRALINFSSNYLSNYYTLIYGGIIGGIIGHALRGRKQYGPFYKEVKRKLLQIQGL